MEGATWLCKPRALTPSAWCQNPGSVPSPGEAAQTTPLRGTTSWLAGQVLGKGPGRRYF